MQYTVLKSALKTSRRSWKWKEACSHCNIVTRSFCSNGYRICLEDEEIKSVLQVQMMTLKDVMVVIGEDGGRGAAEAGGRGEEAEGAAV